VIPRKDPVIVVGTTPDYIDEIRRKAPGEAIFLTDRNLRRRAIEEPPGPQEELLGDLASFSAAAALLREHLERWGLRPGGVACYDCEALELAAFLAEGFALPFASPEAVARCRDKFRCKELWRAHRVPCPEARGIATEEELLAFWASLEAPVVLKPRRGTGSELVFRAETPEECRRAFAALHEGVRRCPELGGMVAEEYVAGPEYSCDFLVSAGEVHVLRLTRKMPLAGTFGGTRGYLLCPRPPRWWRRSDFSPLLVRAAAALGLSRAFCMVDFILRRGEPLFLELAPRPGGDCLPPLLRVARGWDPLLAELAFARGRDEKQDPFPGGPGHLGLRLVASRGGVVRRLHTAPLEEDPRVLAVGGLRGPGHRVILPPEDYDSRILGYAIARLEPRKPEIQAQELDALWRVEMAP